MKFKHKVAVSLLNIISRTWKVSIEGKFPSKPGIILFWHGKMLPAWKSFSKYAPVGVVSQSKDGQILSALLKKWNFELIRGSSSKGGKEVLQQMQNKAKNNFLLITPDGPRGPYQKMKPGGVITAHRTSVPVYLCGVIIRKKKIFENSWDKFNLPLPFTSIILNFSEKIEVSNNLGKNEIDQLIEKLEKDLNKLDVGKRDTKL